MALSVSRLARLIPKTHQFLPHARAGRTTNGLFSLG
jgi:hypothetical protein